MLMFAAILLITACKKDEEKLDSPRLFKASDIKIEAGQTAAKITWAVPLFASGKPLAYTVDFSTDANFATIAYSKVVDTAGITVTEENISVRTPYFARIKANAFEKGNVRISPIEIQIILITRTPAHTLISSKKKLKAIINDPRIMILIFGKAFLSIKPTVGISRAKIKSPFKVINNPV